MNPLRDAWTDRLSEYVDGELDAAERAALEVHLQLCEACAATVEELRMVVERAGALEPRAPEADLWPAIEARITGPRRTWWLDRSARPAARGVSEPRRWSFTLPQLAAAAALIVMLSSVGMWVALSRRPAATGSGPIASAPAVPAAVPAGFEVARYDAAIADLERVLKEHRDQLDPATVRVIEHNLLVIDQATAQARKALAADPASAYLNGHLTAQLKRKISLLRQATAIVAAHG